MLGEESGKQLIKYVPDYVVFDLETTGISYKTDDIIEISAVRVRSGKMVDEYSQLVNPRRHIPSSASNVNNIFDHMVEDSPCIEHVLPEFLDFIGDDVLVGHNINSFDMKFMYRDCERYFYQTLANDYIDTLKIAKICFPEWHHRRLSDLAEYYGISTEGAHRALADCYMNQRVFEYMNRDMSSDNASKGTKRPTCPLCGSLMTVRSGKYGAFWGCTNYPECKHTVKII